jgi:heme exporter protein B
LNSASPEWRRQVLAVLRKEWRTEMRSRSGFLTATLFSIVGTVAISFSTYAMKVSGSLAAGLLWTAWLFGAAVGLPRVFLVEEDLRTGDLLRLWANPYAVYWGKLLFNMVQISIMGGSIALIFVVLVNREIYNPILFIVSLLVGNAALAGAVTLCGGLAARAANRSTMAAAISVPLLMPLVMLGVSALRVSMGDGFPAQGTQALIGLIGYTVATVGTGPAIFAAVWKA